MPQKELVQIKNDNFSSPRSEQNKVAIWTKKPSSVLIFKRCLYFVDKFSDFLYIFLPCIAIYIDGYNQNRYDPLLFLAQLNTRSASAFIAVYFPLFFLCFKCLWISITSTYRMRKQYFEDWRCQIDPNHDTQSTTSNEDWDKNWIHKNEGPYQGIIKRGGVRFLYGNIYQPVFK